ncbi:Pimeloyl-ACP methyl ester carboxylesterase [Fructilactobacillus lindneri DSM 20690 = JCM 11027]|nr:Pimeloyl-ACP methyl ester carboxylesterase [Fructilactobacillus lindneri DSM 20690 = JCM 11027]
MMLNYYEKGEGFPLFFLHGYELDSHFLMPIFEPYFKNVKGFKRIYIDLPGMGKSRNFNLIISDVVLSQIIELINSFHFTNFLIIGQSYGGYLALGLRAFFKRELISEFLVVPMVVPDRQQRRLEKLTHQFVHKQHQLFDTEFQAMNSIISQSKFYQYKKLIDKTIKENDNHKLTTFGKSRKYALKKDPVKQESNLEMMILLGKVDNVVGFKDHNLLKKYNENIDIKIFENSGHNLLIDERDQALKLFDIFIKNIIIS